MAILEGFETWTSGLPDTQVWNLDGGGPNVPTQSTGYATQGTYGARFYSDDPGIDGIHPIYTDPIDLTAANTLYVDVRMAQSEQSGGFYGTALLGLFSADFSQQLIISTDGVAIPEDVTLELDISAASFKSSCRLYVGPSSTVGGGPFEFFMDNLRDDAGGGASVGSGLITGLKLNRMSLV